jgi:ribonuclease HI
MTPGTGKPAKGRAKPEGLRCVTIHTDGGCDPNPGPGGWAAVLECGPHRREISGGEPATTNNRMELRAAIEALGALTERCEVELFTDSQYVKNGVTAWIHGWKRNGWKTQAREPVKNEDLWRALDAQAARHSVNWRWLKGHAGHKENERCDVLATTEIGKIRARYSRDELRQMARGVREAAVANQTDLLPLPGRP